MANLLAGLADWIDGLSQARTVGILTIAAVTAVVIILIRIILPRLLQELSERTRIDYGRSAWRHISLPASLIVLAIGLWAIAQELPIPENLISDYHQRVDVIAAVLLTGIICYGLLRLFNALAEYYAAPFHKEHDPRVIYAEALRKITNVMIVAIAILVVLSQLGYEIGPLLASLGVAGIAVALALQDTLGNLFAGFYLIFDQPVRTGDYIKLDSGEEGFVQEIGWRNTRIRPWDNNIVILPNTKLSEATITNWHLPEPDMAVYVSCGVDYGSDLEHVEQVCVEVAKQVAQRVEGGTVEPEPLVRFKQFADSNINFLVRMFVTDPVASYGLSHEFIKALHKRFKQEDIEISWPVQKVTFPEGAPMGPGTM